MFLLFYKASADPGPCLPRGYQILSTDEAGHPGSPTCLLPLLFPLQGRFEVILASLSLSLHVPNLSSLPTFPSSLPPTLSPHVCSVTHSLRLSFIQFMIQFLAEIISKQLLMTKATHGSICCCSKVDKSILGTKFRSAKFEP